MVPLADAVAIPGRGLKGDRYFHAAGTFSHKHSADSELTLIESETLDALACEPAVALTPEDSRRNLVTRGVALRELVGREFMIGEVRVLGHTLCQPCSRLRGLIGRPD